MTWVKQLHCYIYIHGFIQSARISFLNIFCFTTTHAVNRDLPDKLAAVDTGYLFCIPDIVERLALRDYSN